MKTTLIIFFLTFITCSFAQSGKLKKADNLYNKVAYAEAITLYSELIGSEMDSPEMRSRLADSYYQIGASDKAEETYASFVTTSDSEAEVFYRYAQALKENGKYAESDKWMATFHAKTNDDIRAKEFVENKDYLSEINAQEAYFSISHLSTNTKYSDFGGYQGSDGKVYFVSNRKKQAAIKRFSSFNDKKFLDLYAGNKTGNSIENPEYLPKKNKKYHEGPLCFNPEKSRVYFTRNNMSTGMSGRDDKGIMNLKIYMADVNEDGTWGNEMELPINSKDYSVGHPSIAADGKTMYFASDMPGGFGGVDIYKMKINADGTFGKPVNLGSEVNTEGQEMFPWISSDGTLFFSSDGRVGLGGLDVFAAIFDKNGKFKKCINVGKPVNSNKDDFALVMNADNKTGFVSSNRTTGTGSDDMYSFSLLRPIKVNLSVKGVITNLRTTQPIPGATVELLDASGNVVKSMVADSKGNYAFDLEEDQNYQLNVKKDDYFDNSGSVSTRNLSAGTEVIEENLTLEKDPGLSLYALISDSKTGKPLEGVAVTLVNNMTGESNEIVTLSTGDFRRALNDKKLNDRGSYNLTLQKEGYIPKTVTYNIEFDREGQYDVHVDVDLKMDPMVKDLRELIQINPINFDLGKWNIRPDAEEELDKIVEIMNKYPDMVVELGSHTDCRASKAFNMRLSDKRAKSSATYIKSKITNPERIYGKGYGESQLLNGCECEGSVKSDCSEEEHEKNRRTEFKVISVSKEQ